MIVWLNGGFGAGKTTLAAELHRRLPDAVVYDPEDVGLMLWKWLPPNEDFQDLPSWRELVVATALSLRRHHARTLIVPMSLLRDGYRAEILDGLAAAGEEVLHVFLDTAPEVLRDRLRARTPPPDDHRPDGSALDWALSRLDPAARAGSRRGPSSCARTGSPRRSWPTPCWPPPTVRREGREVRARSASAFTLPTAA